MYIAPNSEVRFLKNVPLTKKYLHTIYFANRSAQTNYFASKTKLAEEKVSYQRANLGEIRVERTTAELYDVNYMMFKNASYENKWFYAFVDEIIYINDRTTAIRYTQDPLQTWFFETELGDSWIDREIPPHDLIGGNLEPEPVELGEYVLQDYKIMKESLVDMCVIIGVSDVTEGEKSSGKWYDRNYSGTTYYAYLAEDIEHINNFLSAFIQSPDSVIALYCCPQDIIDPDHTKITLEHGIELTSGTQGNAINISGKAINTDDKLDGYKPINKKLYTYPYSFYHVDNGVGQELNLRYEFFEKFTPTLYMQETFTQPVRILLTPNKYYGERRAGGGDVIHRTQAIALENYPVCNWNFDSFEIWYNQNIGPNIFKTVTNVAQGAVAGAVAGGPIGAVTGAAAGVFSGVVGTMMDGYNASITADLIKGSINNSTVAQAHGFNTFFSGRGSITHSAAERIDNFFGMYGYKTNRIKKPERNARPHWTYTKTIGANVSGNVPADDLTEIAAIYDAGITFWRNGDEVGDYSLNNRPEEDQ